ncbi:spoOJ protein [Campylobacter sputorum subsp. bubulus]|uniref:SpoOJ protein n=1 Tax=Campylobacter sputorum subsp. sputorum TaxID=32024 RepID=A0A381DJG9_9BACT|nr:ParB/RepB/Spo0J family partition protein [Campylobacter sputorum]ASM35827.1 chromosome partitioning protein [Campylobacter sputorum aubsp. sputorum RM3237]KAB0581540.1 ParB/RepB/Spo0J family partition protein [Campylobacter sputorum subsp. sputorum]QEL06017.1 chromosome partitioning protein [Campylobacter sputorum subsp. sputorum]SUX09127.1 spoOJ protein [Campylobacter sputorum subsp. bubulus]SUX10818.1 spoOJ protein [Campylobacter sputorum subsp. sputorum]
MAKKPSLGRGLEAILGDVEEAYVRELESGSKSDMVLELQVSKILPNPFQPRKNFDKNALEELAASIQKHGLLQPIVVKQDGENYVIIAGERRFRATKILGKETIRAIVADMKSQNLRELALIENIQREDLNPIELANSYKELIDEYNITQDALADIIKKSRAQITNTLRLLTLDDKTKHYLSIGEISQGHAKIMVGLSKNDELAVLDTIIGQKLSVRDTENLVKNIKNQKIDKNKTNTSKNINYIDEFNILKIALNEIGINSTLKGKNIILKFNDIDSLKNLIEKIK